jgi:hypothetical protein
MFYLKKKKLFFSFVIESLTFLFNFEVAGTLIYKSPEYKILYLLKSGLVEFEGVKLS